MVSHGLAILSLPFIAFGFWGLSTALLTKGKTAMLAFFISCFGLLAAMIAATINGLTLPLFLLQATARNIDTNLISPAIIYGRNINIPMDYILLSSFVLSISIWSVLIIRAKQFSQWTGYYGLSLIFIGGVAVFNRYNVIGLAGFRIVVFGIVSWIIIAAAKILLSRPKQP